MRHTYDDEADALYIYLSEGETFGRSVVVGEDVVMDLDVNGVPMGIEVLEASQGFDLKDVVVRFHLQDQRDRLNSIQDLAFRRAVRA